MIDFTHCNIRCNGLRKEKILLALLAAIGLPKAAPWLKGKTPALRRRAPHEKLNQMKLLIEEALKLLEMPAHKMLD